jgi:hypothetical protein
MIHITAAAMLTLPAQAGEQTRIYGPDGKSVGTATPDSAGTVRFRDAQGRSLGTSSTTGGTTTFMTPRQRDGSRDAPLALLVAGRPRAEGPVA